MTRLSAILVCLIVFVGVRDLAAEQVQHAPTYRAELVFPLHGEHNHAPGIIECPNGDLLVSWYRGSGERTADDVAVYGSRQRRGETSWSEAFLMADFPNFPDCNTCMMIDRQQRLWLFWPIILANSWESCVTNYLVAREYTADGPPKWYWHSAIFLRPDDYQEQLLKAMEERLANRKQPLSDGAKSRIEEYRQRAGSKLYQRLGWQPRCKPTVLPSGRILLPLYTDTFSASMMAISDDDGRTWYASQPMIGNGNIQPSVLRRDDGTLVAYMRENGPRDRIRVSESHDDGISWSPVTESEFPNPGAGVDGVRLQNGHWVLVYNDTTKGRMSLAISLSDDEGRTWKWKRHLEQHERGAYHYPVVIQSRSGLLNVVYSYFVEGGKSMKHATFDEAWIKAGE